MPVYVRVNTPWGLNGAWNIDASSEGGNIICTAPDDEYPNYPYTVMLWTDFTSQESDTPFSAGQVLEINGSPDALPVDSPSVVFSKS